MGEAVTTITRLLILRAGKPGHLSRGETMNEEVLNQGIRRFLKEFGIAAQGEIEDAVHAAIRAGKLDGSDSIRARARLELPELGTYFDIERVIPLE
jgi:hypothetical protein